MGDTQGELLERLKRVPRDLQDVYSRIFTRLPDALKDEANTILLLVCGAKRTLMLQELYLAVSIARKETLHGEDDDENMSLPLELLNAFRRRVLARTGGLLEIADSKLRENLEAYDLSLDTSKYDEKKWEVKLIHETVRPFIETNQGAVFFPPSLGNIAAPRSLWLDVCVRSVREALPTATALALPLYQPLTDGMHWWDEALNRVWRQFPLAMYTLCFLFDHARELEMLDGLSSYESLKSIRMHDLGCLHVITAYKFGDLHCVWCEGRESLALYPGTISDHDPSWMWAAVHGLAKYCTSVFAKGESLRTRDGSILESVMNIYKPSTKIHDSHLKANMSTVSVLVENNVLIKDNHIIKALKAAPPQLLNLLLRDHPPGKLRLEDSDGEIVGPFWVLVCDNYDGSYFRRTVDYLLRRGENLNANSEPAGTPLHAPLWAMSDNILWRYEFLLTKGANPNISGPAGTSLRLAWKRVLDGRVPTGHLSVYQGLNKLLLDYGARIDWVDEDGVAPTEREIRAYCELQGSKRLGFCSKESLR